MSIMCEMDKEVLAHSHNGMLPTKQMSEVRADTKSWASLPDVMCEGNQTKECTLYDSSPVTY